MAMLVTKSEEPFSALEGSWAAQSYGVTPTSQRIEKGKVDILRGQNTVQLGDSERSSLVGLLRECFLQRRHFAVFRKKNLELTGKKSK